ncbi:hypothetical protein Goari_016110 [Gossypium aridum]|uniref:Uncharacterized protein n=1 Tax=Gossypium aridum TaxID=34290 RepID=A0A7J8WHI6_GOSAI|nr:hypothetical protein [Gossypium aridum]
MLPNPQKWFLKKISCYLQMDINSTTKHPLLPLIQVWEN